MFALVDFNRLDETDVHLMSLYERWMISSDPKVTGGAQMIKMWVVMRNFFESILHVVCHNLNNTDFQNIS